MHGKNLVHRDVKLDNMLLVDDLKYKKLVCKLTDFTIS